MVASFGVIGETHEQVFKTEQVYENNNSMDNHQTVYCDNAL